MPQLRIFSAALFAASVAAFVGCGGDRPSMGQVEGTVTYKGQPLPNGTISFIPENGRGASGIIEAGQIKNVSCFEPNDGVPVGVSKVTITAFAKQGEGSTAPTKALIPDGYGNPEWTPLRAEIKSGMNTLKFELK